jgi:hypothetical protein
MQNRNTGQLLQAISLKICSEKRISELDSHHSILRISPMQTIDIKALDAHSFEVKVQGSNTTTHIVSVRPDYAEKLAGRAAPVESLIRKSFEFLLERESNTSILRSFDLSVIARYFPEYEREIGKMLAQPSQTSAS